VICNTRSVTCRQFVLLAVIRVSDRQPFRRGFQPDATRATQGTKKSNGQRNAITLKHVLILPCVASGWKPSHTCAEIHKSSQKTAEMLVHCIHIVWIYTVSQKTSHLWLAITWHTWMNFDIFGRNVTDKVGNQRMLYYATSDNLCFCTTWQNRETRKSHFLLNWTVLHTMHLCAAFPKEKVVICDVFDSV